MSEYSGHIDSSGRIYISGGYEDVDVETNPYIKLLHDGASDREIQLTYERDLKNAQENYSQIIHDNDADDADELTILRAKRLSKDATALAQRQIERVRDDYSEYIKESKSYAPYDAKSQYRIFRICGAFIGVITLLIIVLWGFDWSVPGNYLLGIVGIIFYSILGAILGVIVSSIVCKILKLDAKSKYDAMRNQ